MQDTQDIPEASEADKAQTKTVSLSRGLWIAVGKRARQIAENDRSAYFRKLVRADLKEAGMLPDDVPASLDAFQRLRDLVGDQEAERLVRLALTEAATAAAATLVPAA